MLENLYIVNGKSEKVEFFKYFGYCEEEAYRVVESEITGYFTSFSIDIIRKCFKKGTKNLSNYCFWFQMFQVDLGKAVWYIIL